MARARRKKAKAPRKHAAKRKKALTRQSSNNWQVGAGVLALVVLGAGAYLVSMNDNARTTVASLVERIEIPESVKNLPDSVKQNLPEMPSLTNSSSSDVTGARSNESAPSSN